MGGFQITLLVPLFALAAFATIVIALRRSPALRRVVAAASLPAMVGVQLYRALGVTFLILLALGQLPAHFALPAGWGDIVVGLTAPLVALALARRVAGAAPLAIVWNLFGLLDLIVAFGMGTGLLAPYLMPELGTRVPAAAAIGVFPMILVPVFAVPIAVLLHVVALGRLLRGVRLGSRLVPGPARQDLVPGGCRFRARQDDHLRAEGGNGSCRRLPPFTSFGRVP